MRIGSESPCVVVSTGRRPLSFRFGRHQEIAPDLRIPHLPFPIPHLRKFPLQNLLPKAENIDKVELRVGRRGRPGRTYWLAALFWMCRPPT